MVTLLPSNGCYGVTMPIRLVGYLFTFKFSCEYIQYFWCNKQKKLQNLTFCGWSL